MTVRRQIALGTLVKVDHDSDATYTTVQAVMNVKLPSRKRKKVETTALDDTMEQSEGGIEEETEGEGTLYWDPTDVNCSMLDTLFANKTKCNWQAVLPFATPITATFQGRVDELDPEPLEKDKAIARKFKVTRTGAITYA